MVNHNLLRSFTGKFNLVKLISLTVVVETILFDIPVVHSENINDNENQYICQINYKTNTPEGNNQSSEIVKTIVKTSDKEMIELVTWEGENALKNCQFTTQKFQEFSDSDLLKPNSLYIHSFDEYKAICIKRNDIDNNQCQPEDILVFISSEQNPETSDVLKNILGYPQRINETSTSAQNPAQNAENSRNLRGNSNQKNILDSPCPPVLCD